MSVISSGPDLIVWTIRPTSQIAWAHALHSLHCQTELWLWSNYRQLWRGQWMAAWCPMVLLARANQLPQPIL